MTNLVLRHVKKSSRCKVCDKTILPEKRTGEKGCEKVVCFYAHGSHGRWIHICQDCSFRILEKFAEDNGTEVVED